jgi:hypothetical protein
MDHAEAKALLHDCLQSYRPRSYDDLVLLLGEPRTTVVRGASGTEYQLEIEVFWDHRPGGAVRVLGAVDDGGLRAFKPLLEDFILAPDGNEVGGEPRGS